MHVNASPWSTVARGEFEHAKTPNVGQRAGQGRQGDRRLYHRARFDREHGHMTRVFDPPVPATDENSGLSPPTLAHAFQLTSLLQALASLRTVAPVLRGVCLHPPFL